MVTTTHAEEQQQGPPAPPLADIVRRLTNDGELIIGFLVTAMQGDIPDIKPPHRIQAAGMLVKLGFNDADLPEDIRSPARVSARPDPVLSLSNGRPRSSARPSRLDAELARFVRDETDGGRDAIRFLVDVMQGDLTDFKPHHRIAAARELLRRGFDRSTGGDVPTEPEPGPAPKPEVPEGFVVAPEGVIELDVFSPDSPAKLSERMFKHKKYRDWAKRKKEEGWTFLKPNWWQEGLEEVIDEDSLTLIEAVQQAADAQGITIAPHLLEATRLKEASKREAVPQEETESESKAEPEVAVPQEQDLPEDFAEEEDTDVPWSKPGYFYSDQLSRHELKVLEKGGDLHWDTPQRRFP